MKKISITTTLPYVNADPHIGFALEIIQADIIARWYRQQGDEVFFNTGTDEHGVKVYRKALEAKKELQAYVDENAAKFDRLKEALNLSYNSFIRTTDSRHIVAAQEFWKRCAANGDIYVKHYKIKYCSGCELEKTESELVDGKCPIHPNLELELIEEENYFFRFSKYQEKLLKLYDDQSDFVVPDWRLKEIRSFVARGLEDFSISRLKEKMPWGIAVPGDDSHVMYVWFDALINYISCLGWPEEKYKDWWPSVQFAGKDNLRQQSAMWQAMLMSAGLPASKQIMIHGFINSGGQKMSKSLGNVINPVTIVDEYGADALRYYLARHVNPFEDSDFTMEKFKEAYNAGLANGLGNFVSRVMAMSQKGESGLSFTDQTTRLENLRKHLDSFNFNSAMEHIWQTISDGDAKIQETKPFELLKTDPEKAKEVLADLVWRVHAVGVMLEPFMPETSKIILEAVRENKKPDNLFPRKD